MPDPSEPRRGDATASRSNTGFHSLIIAKVWPDKLQLSLHELKSLVVKAPRLPNDAGARVQGLEVH